MKKIIVEMTEEEYKKCQEILDEGILTHKINKIRFSFNDIARRLTYAFRKYEPFSKKKFRINYEKLCELCKEALSKYNVNGKLVIRNTDYEGVINNLVDELIGWPQNSPILDIIEFVRSGESKDGSFDYMEAKRIVTMCVKEVINDMFYK